MAKVTLVDCPHGCGKKNHPSNTFCGGCGKSMSTSTPASAGTGTAPPASTTTPAAPATTTTPQDMHTITLKAKGKKGRYDVIVNVADENGGAAEVSFEILFDDQGEVHRTDPSGSATVPHNFESKKCKVTAEVIGHPSNIARIELDGPPWEPQGTTFIERVKERIAYNRGESR